MSPEDFDAIRAMLREELATAYQHYFEQVSQFLESKMLKRPPVDISGKRRRAAQIRWERQRKVNGAVHDAHAMHLASAVEAHEHNGSDAIALHLHDAKGRKAAKPAKERFELPGWVPTEQWQAYCDMRQRIRKPMTDRAKVMAVAKLAEFRDAGHHPAAVLGQSIFNSWQGLFEPRNQ